MYEINGFEDLMNAKGETLGTSSWHEVTQDTINKFAEVTGDHQWIHVDEERAAESPFGSTIAHGFYTLSLYPVFMEEVVKFDGFKFMLNYGCNKVRFMSPVPVNSKIRGTAKVAEVSELEGGAQMTIEMVWEVEGSEKPVCVAEALVRAYG